MRAKIFALLLFFMSVLLCVSIPAQAFTFTFTDSSNFWPGWGNGEDDGSDSLAIPQFTGGKGVISGGRLTKLTFEQTTGSHSLWPLISPGDLFLSVDPDTDWEYFVDLTGWTVAGTANTAHSYNGPGPSNDYPGSGSYNLYSISLPLGSSGGVRPPNTPAPQGYILSGIDNSGEWSGYQIRDNHPVAYDFTSDLGDRELVGTVWFSGWSGTQGSPTYTFDFSRDSTLGGGLPLYGECLTTGWTVNCANDVVYEQICITPEPASLFLMGSGLIGIGWFGRRKFRKSRSSP